jgi:hypothetical protein
MISLDPMTVPTPLQITTRTPQLMVRWKPSGLPDRWSQFAGRSPQVLFTSVSLGTLPLQKQPSLFTEGKEETSVDAGCLLATAVITLFSVSNKEVPTVVQASSCHVVLSHGLSAWSLHARLRTVPKVKLERCGAFYRAGGSHEHCW